MSFKVTKKVSDVAADVKRTFGDEASVQVTDPDIIRWINQAQTEIVSKNQILLASGITPSIANQYTYDLSALNIQSIRSIHYDGTKLENLTFQEAEETVLKDDPKRTASGTPEVWYTWGNSELMLYPTPSTSGVEIKVYFYATPSVVDTVNDYLSLPDNYYSRILEFVMACAYEMDENFAAAEQKTNRFDSNLVAMHEDENKSAQDYYPTITVRPEDQ